MTRTRLGENEIGVCIFIIVENVCVTLKCAIDQTHLTVNKKLY